MFKVVSLKPIMVGIALVLISVILGVGLVQVVSMDAVPKTDYVVLLDAGHGGIDGGCVGTTTGATEAEINLKVVKKLETMLKAFGFKVVLTRTNNNGLYSQFSNNKKVDDMEKRKQIIEKSNADIVVSVHMNSFSDKTQHGAQSFFQQGSIDGENLATCIQAELQKNLVEAREFANHSDLFILKCTQNPSVVVEGGFLTNPSEEELLITDEYQSKLAYSIFCGIVKFYVQSHQN